MSFKVNHVVPFHLQESFFIQITTFMDNIFLSEKFQKKYILNNLSNISQNLVKLSHAKLKLIKITHPKAAEL